jgi:hypothetical protein
MTSSRDLRIYNTIGQKEPAVVKPSAGQQEVTILLPGPKDSFQNKKSSHPIVIVRIISSSAKEFVKILLSV